MQAGGVGDPTSPRTGLGALRDRRIIDGRLRCHLPRRYRAIALAGASGDGQIWRTARFGQRRDYLQEWGQWDF